MIVVIIVHIHIPPTVMQALVVKVLIAQIHYQQIRIMKKRERDKVRPILAIVMAMVMATVILTAIMMLVELKVVYYCKSI